MVKDMSLAANIAVAEMFYTTQRIVAVTYEALALYIELALVYLIFCTVLTFLQRFIEKKIDITRRQPKKIDFQSILPDFQRMNSRKEAENDR